MDVVTELALGRQAFEERAWATAYQRLAALDPDALAEQDRIALATAAFLSGDREAADRAYQESYRHHVDSGSTLAAARDTFWLGMLHNTTGNPAVGGGWVARGARLLQDAPPDAVEHGYQAVHEMFRHIFSVSSPPRSSSPSASRRPDGGAGRQTSSRWACRARGGYSSTAEGFGRDWPSSTRPWSASPIRMSRRSSPATPTARWWRGARRSPTTGG